MVRRSARFIPYGDTAATGNGITFTPNVTPIYNLTDDDFKADNNEDPLQVTRSDPYQAYNVWRLEIAERDNAYNLTPSNCATRMPSSYTACASPRR